MIKVTPEPQESKEVVYVCCGPTWQMLQGLGQKLVTLDGMKVTDAVETPKDPADSAKQRNP